MEAARKHLIYLTGFMGSGKTTIAPILANTLGYSFVDIDREIEAATGKKVSEIFSELGEEYFREVERSLLADLQHREGCVVSLGGGTIANDPNLKAVKDSGILIYLKVDPEQIFQRMKYKTDRPLLRPSAGVELTDQELRSRIENLLVKREPYYCQADFTITTTNQRVGVTVDEIVRRLRRLWKAQDYPPPRG